MEALIQAALEARGRAFAPYSAFLVGAALRLSSGEIYTGCNVESASYGLTICAERVAIFKAVSDGHLEFTALCVVADSPQLTAPCGACRQIIWEFCGDIPILMTNLQGKRLSVTTSEILPLAFDRNKLEAAESKPEQ